MKKWMSAAAAAAALTLTASCALAAIQILYLSIIHINQIGPNFFPTLRLLVVGACEELVA